MHTSSTGDSHIPNEGFSPKFGCYIGFPRLFQRFVPALSTFHRSSLSAVNFRSGTALMWIIL